MGVRFANARILAREKTMRKIELNTPDGAVENINKLTELFPQVVTVVQNGNGELERTVDFDALRDLLGDVPQPWPRACQAK